MAAARAEREEAKRGIDGDIIIGGVDPVESVHDEIGEAMPEVGIDDRTSRQITPDGIDNVETW